MHLQGSFWIPLLWQITRHPRTANACLWICETTGRSECARSFQANTAVAVDPPLQVTLISVLQPRIQRQRSRSRSTLMSQQPVLSYPHRRSPIHTLQNPPAARDSSSRSVPSPGTGLFRHTGLAISVSGFTQTDPSSIHAHTSPISIPTPPIDA